MWSFVLGLIIAAVPGRAQTDAGASTMDVSVEVVHATRQGTKVEPASLAWLKHQFSENGINFTGFRRLAEHHLTLEQGRPIELSLPNSVTASLKLEELSDSAGQVRIGKRGQEVMYTLSDHGPVFVDVGPFEHGRLFLIVSSARDFRSHQKLSTLRDGG
jgi:hypothetical protein